MAISIVYPASVIEPEEAQMASHEELTVCVSIPSLWAPSGLQPK